MTRAPDALLRPRRLLLDHLNGNDDLEPAEVGIVGDPAHRGGYHCGSDRTLSRDYSVVESPRDNAGLTLDASALDVGQFSVRTRTGVHNLRTFSTWCVAQCEANAPDTRDIREIIYSPDGKVVRRWDRLRRRTGGDNSHLWHTHFSYFRDAIKAGRDQSPLFRRYLITIGLIESEINMDLTPDNLADIGQSGWAFKPADHGGKTAHAIVLNGHTASLARIEAQLAALSGRDFTDEPEIIAGVLAGVQNPELLAQAFILAGWTPEKYAAAIPADLAAEVVDALSTRLARQ